MSEQILILHHLYPVCLNNLNLTPPNSPMSEHISISLDYHILSFAEHLSTCPTYPPLQMSDLHVFDQPGPAASCRHLIHLLINDVITGMQLHQVIQSLSLCPAVGVVKYGHN